MSRKHPATVGPDCESGGSVAFVVYLDDKEIFNSGILKGRKESRKVDVSLKGGKTLKLVVRDGGDGVGGDHADWADLTVTTDDPAIFQGVRGGKGTFILKGRLMDELVPAEYYFTGDLSRLNAWIKPVKGEVLAFRTIGQPRDVALRPYNVLRPRTRGNYEDLIDTFGQLWWQPKAGSATPQKRTPTTDAGGKRFAVYRVMARDGSDPRLKRIREEHARFLNRKARLVDLVYPRDESERVAYRNRREKGAKYGWGMIHAFNDAWFSWDMKVLPDEPMNLLVFYTFRVFRPASALLGPNRHCDASFDILVDEKVIATKRPYDLSARWEHCVEYGIPPGLTKGKDTVTVKFRPHRNRRVRVWGCATTRQRKAEDAG